MSDKWTSFIRSVCPCFAGEIGPCPKWLIQINTVLTKIGEKLVFAPIISKIASQISAFQKGVGNSFGIDTNIHSARLQTELHPENSIIEMDFSNGFNSLHHQPVWSPFYWSPDRSTSRRERGSHLFGILKIYHRARFSPLLCMQSTQLQSLNTSMV